MAKKKTTRGRKSKKPEAPQHELPVGFWSQVAAITLIAFSVLLVVSWFGGGGDFLNWVRDFSLRTIGLATYVLPFVSIYVAIQVFKVENNKLPGIMKFASLLLIVWFSGLFGLFRQDHQPSTGGIVGDTLSGVMTGLVNMPVGVFIYILLIMITSLFVLRLSFGDVGSMLKSTFGNGEKSEDEANVTIMRRAAEADKPMTDFKLNAGVPTLSPEDKKKAHLASLKNSVKPDKEAEEKAAMLAVTDPNWKFPHVELLEKKQSPADAGDIQQNAHIIQDTLREFSIDVEMEGANIGPKVTQYTLKPPAGIKLSRITALETNIALNLAASTLRMEAPIPGQKAVGIEVPNKKAADVRIRGILDTPEWRKADEPLSFAIGKDISGLPVVGELNKMPHLL
ncbi:MAG TPA: DNA translocase FtsK 4TM domain-containing protein, partial [Enterobacter roggenkampii]|nr:DNA translocase FtsK 4TM domain-containing protein [Enterobacter roggenkampii]